jgi:hypothetical protein
LYAPTTKMPILHTLTLSEKNNGTINANFNIILCHLVNSHNDQASKICYICVRKYFGRGEVRVKSLNLKSMAPT